MLGSGLRLYRVDAFDDGAHVPQGDVRLRFQKRACGDDL